MTLKDFIETFMDNDKLTCIGVTNYIRVIRHAVGHIPVCPEHPYYLELKSLLSIGAINETSFMSDYIKTISCIDKKFNIEQEYPSYFDNSVESITVDSIELRNGKTMSIIVIIITDYEETFPSITESDTRDSDSNFKDALKHIICKSIDDEYLKTLIIKTWEE